MEKAVMTVVKILFILTFFSFILYLAYHYTVSHFEKAEHIQHMRSEEAVKSIEVMQGSTKELLAGGKQGTYYIIKFELEEGQSWRVENVLLSFDYYDFEDRRFVVSIYCNDKPYDVIEKYFLGEGTSYNFKFECNDWTSINYFSVSIKPLLIRKEVRWLNDKALNRNPAYFDMILNFEVKVYKKEIKFKE